MAFCTKCGKQIADSALICPSCGAAQAAIPVAAPAPVVSPAVISAQAVIPGATDKRILPAFLLCFFFGVFGAHRFYVGKIGSGIAQLLTFGGLGIWALVDLILLVCSAFTDGKGNKITAWT